MSSGSWSSRVTPQFLPAVRTGLLLVLFLLVFLTGVRGLGDGFKLLGGDLLDAFFSATSNPFTALMIGLLSTTLMQSSSVTTSMVVGLVAASENPLPLANAVPMIMGANIGTTVTNTIVSLAHAGRKDEFRRAFAVATCHDFFNYLSVLILLPLEITTGFLSKTASIIAQPLGSVGGGTFESPLTALLKSILVPLNALANTLFDTAIAQGAVIIFASGVLIFSALTLIIKVLQSALHEKAEELLEKSLGKSVFLAIFVGCLITTMVQSSSITTSLLVPMAGVGILTLERAFPVTLGANIGTTVTALMASLAVSGPNALAGVEIAVTHMLFNLAGSVLIYSIRPVRELLLGGVRHFANLAVRSKILAVAYMLLVFYGLPALAAYFG